MRVVGGNNIFICFLSEEIFAIFEYVFYITIHYVRQILFIRLLCVINSVCCIQKKIKTNILNCIQKKNFFPLIRPIFCSSFRFLLCFFSKAFVDNGLCD